MVSSLWGSLSCAAIADVSPRFALLRQFASSPASSDIRNVAIIAHVDHGKTTLIDRLLAFSGATLGEDRVMDSNVFEKERGITISAKYTSFTFEGTTFNIVDTPVSSQNIKISIIFSWWTGGGIPFQSLQD